MFIGHLPSSYLLYKLAAPRNLPDSAFRAGMLGAIFPDIDMLWFYLIDDRGHHHHWYLTHRPAVWIGLIILCGLLMYATRTRHGLTGMSFCAGALTHIAFDTIAGRILWLWPLSDGTFTMVIVQPTHSHYILSFLAHWTFKVEIAVTIVAVVVFLRSRFLKRQPDA